MSRPVIGLLSDFGTRDHYVGSMKAVAAAICPDASFIDITHDVPPHDVVTATLELAACYKYFAAGTIFLVVVDPGVGSSRPGLAAEAGDYRFVAPDNGVLTAVFRETPPKRIVELTERRYARPTVSRTFEGRDRFAPAAAWLAKGIQLSALGRPLSDYHMLDLPVPQTGPDSVTGQVQRVDRFGNLVTNIDRKTFERLAQGAAIHVRAGDHDIARIVATYAAATGQEVCALFGSTDHLEIAVNGGSAAERLGLGLGTPVLVRRT